MLRNVDWLLFTDVSGQPVDPIFKCQAVKEEFLVLPFIQNVRAYVNINYTFSALLQHTGHTWWSML